MNYPMQPIIQHLFQVSRLEDVSRQRLESFVAEYPSFGIGHYLLSRKLQAEGAERYVEETQKTNLYFTNPFWLQLLLESPPDGGARVSAPEPIAPADDQERIAPADDQECIAPAAEPEIFAASMETVKDTMDNVVEESLFAGAEPVTSGAEDHDPPQSMVSLAEAVAAGEEPTAAEQLLQSIEEAKGLRGSLHKMNEGFTTEQPIKDEEAPFVLDEEVMPVAGAPESESVVADVPKATPGSIVAEEPEQATMPETTATEAPATAPEPPATEAPATAPEPPATEAPATAPEPAATEAPATAPEPAATEAPASISSTLAAASLTFTTPVPAAEQTFVFEPYHTIDYFASQGIKLTLEENPSDQLGKQLKSFTDWLKVMRRLPQKEREIIPDRAAEQTVQTIAAHSVVGREIVTETMAEVLAKQGMPDRARAVYEKLSLLNPDKRAYFATKIEQLNSL
ncbi:MAG TPA: hypothetical protein VL727_10905 [Puia sp.]|nr:hypothetical protein [Puia sp.]